MTGYPALGIIFGTTPITFAMNLTAIFCAFGSLAVGFIWKLTLSTYPGDHEYQRDIKFIGYVNQKIESLRDRLKTRTNLTRQSTIKLLE